MRRAILTVTAILVLTNIAFAQIPTIERDGLIALFDNTGGPLWDANTNWLGPMGSECTWYGVTCSGNRVVELNLHSNNLRGPLPPNLGDFTYLTYLNLGHNQLSGGIPAEMGSLINLVEVWLFSSHLEGTIPSELGAMTALERLTLSFNDLSGSIPPELGNLTNLHFLGLSHNQLSGPIPMELGNLQELDQLFLGSNRLGGSIPPELGNLSGLVSLLLENNHLSGSIPPELGNITYLMELFLASNRLSGEIPVELSTLSWLQPGGSDLRWNALYTDDSSLIAFLAAKQVGGDWQSTQTIAPENVTIEWVGDHTAWLSWDSVSYNDPGGYDVFFVPATGGEWASAGWTSDKNGLEIPATALDPGFSYDFAVASFTLPHADNQNLVISDLSEPVMATTANLGCVQPSIEMEWGDPTTLSVLGSFDSYVWNTGETSPTIDVNPYETRFYWVTVTAPGSCQESAIILIGENQVFTDGFESGDTSAWVP